MIKPHLNSSNKKVKVLFLAWGFSIHAKRRIQIFSDDPAFDVHVVSTHNYNFPNAQNVLLNGKFFGLMDALKLRSYVQKTQPDLVFLQTLLYPSYLALTLPKSIPIIITFWNGDVTWWAKWTGLERMFKKQIVTCGVRRAKAITVNSQIAFQACLNYKISQDKIHLIRYPGVDLTLFKPGDKNTAREALGIKADKVILCPRGLGGYFNSDIILDSAKTLIKTYPDLLFIFLSSFVNEEELEKHKQLVKKQGIEQNFRWDGKVPWEKMALYYNSADAMVSISSNDSLPNCMMEAMACGTPVIMSDIPSIREWVTDNANGYLVTPRDADLLSNKIMSTLENSNGHLASFVEQNLDLAKTELDQTRNAQLIKNLVQEVNENYAGTQ